MKLLNSKRLKNKSKFEIQNSKLYKIGQKIAIARALLMEGFYSVHVKVRYLHDKTYQKGPRWYKNWSDKKYSSNVHKTALLGFVASFFFFSIMQSLFPYLFSLKPREVLAGSNTRTWTTNGDFHYNKSTLCSQVSHDAGTVITGNDYTDETCAASASDAEVKLKMLGSIEKTTVGVGSSPAGVAVNSTTNKIYVANDDSNNLSVIDGVNNNVTATVNLGNDPWGVAVNKTTNKIYVTNKGSNTVAVIDGANNTVVTNIAVQTLPYGVAVNETTNKIYVSNYSSNTVSVIDGTNNTVTTNITVGTSPSGVAVNETTNKVYAANYSSNTVSVIDGANNTVSTAVTVGSSPDGVAVNSTTNTIYVANYFGPSVSVINGATNTVTTTISTTITPFGVTVDAALNRIYVSTRDVSGLTVINGATNAVLATVPVTGNPFGFGVGVNTTTKMVYISGRTSASVTVIDSTNDIPVSTVNPLLTSPEGVAVNETTNKVFVAHRSASGKVQVYNGSNNSLEATVIVGSTSYGVAANPTTNKIYVSNFGSANVSIIDGTNNSVSGTVNVGNGPWGIAVNKVTNKIYVANRDTNNVSIINGVNNAVTNVSVGTTPIGVAVNHLTNKIYVANSAGGVSVIDGTNDSVVSTITLTTGPRHVAVNTLTNKIYVSGWIGANMAVIDGTTDTVSTTISTGTNAYPVAVSEATNKIYIGNNGANTISVISGASNTIISTIYAPSPNGIAVNNEKNLIYAVSGNASYKYLSIINKYPSYSATGVTSGLKVDAGLGMKASWSSLSWNAVTPSNTSVKFNARTSDDNSTWSAFSADLTTPGGSSISGLAKTRYLEIQLTLASTDGVSTPTLSDVTVTYDTLDAPTAPSQYKVDGTTEIGANAFTNESTVKLKADLGTPFAGGSPITPEFEVRTADSGWTGNPATPAGVTVSATPTTYTCAANPCSALGVKDIGTINGLSGGTYYYRVRATDAGGRVSAWSTTSTAFSVEQTPPTITSISINTGSSYTTSSLVSVGLVVADTGGSNLSRLYLSNNATDWTDVTPASGFAGQSSYAGTLSWSLVGGGDGPKNVYVKATDNAGNISTDFGFNEGFDNTTYKDAVNTTADWGATVTSQVQLTKGAGSWVNQTSGSSDTLSKAFFLDTNNGWIVGGADKVLKTTNGGSSWSIYSLGNTIYPASVSFSDESNGWVVGNSGSIYKTTNGGQNWSAQNSGTSNNLKDVTFVNSTNGWVVGASGIVLHTNNGGSTWSSQTSGTANTLNSVYFTDLNNGWAAGNAGTIINTTNGGATWSPQISNISSNLNAITFLNSTTGWGVGVSNAITKTTNGGSTWTNVSYAPPSTSFQYISAAFTDELNGWIVGSSYTLQTSNGGSSWSYVSSSNDYRALYAKSGSVWRVGNNGLIWKYFTPYNTPQSAQSLGIDTTAGVITKATLSRNETLNAQTITYYLSVNGGNNWEGPVTPDNEWIFTNTGSDLRWKATLSTTDTSVTPFIRDVAISYKISPLSDSITLDTAPPSAFALSAPANNTWQSSATPTLSWNGSTDAGSDIAKYQLFVDGSLSRDNIVKTTLSTTPGSALSEGTFHTWYVKAIDGAGNITQSSNTLNVGYDATTPPAPQSFTIIGATDNIALSWSFANNNGSPIEKIKAERIDWGNHDPGDPNADWSGYASYQFKEYDGAVTGATYSVSDVDPATRVAQGKKYAYRISAKDSVNGAYGTNSVVQSGLTQDSNFDANIQNVTVAPCDGTNNCSTAATRHKGFEVKITWSPAVDSGMGTSHYLIYRSTNDLNAGNFADASVRSSYQIVGVLPFTGGAQQPVWYDNDLNNAGVNSFVDANGDSIVISGAIQALTTKTQSTSQLDDYVKYYYRIVGVDAGNNKSPVFVESPTTDDYDGVKSHANGNAGLDAERTPDVTAPSVPNNISVVATGIDTRNSQPDPTQGINVSWGASTDNSGRSITYKLYRSLGTSSGPGSWEASPVYTGSAISFQDELLTQDTWYYYKLTASDPDNNTSEESDAEGAKTKNSQIPTAPGYVTVRSSKVKPASGSPIPVNIQFNGSAIRYSSNKITGYEVYRSTVRHADGDEASWLASDKVKTFEGLNYAGYDGNITYDITRSFDDSVSSDATTYFYRVRAVGENSEGIVYGPLSAIQYPGTLYYGWDTTPDFTAPALPSDLKVKDIHDDGVNFKRNIITWARIPDPLRGGVNDFKEYRIYRSGDGLAWQQICQNEQNVILLSSCNAEYPNPLYNTDQEVGLATNYLMDLIPIASANQYYYYYVTAVDDAGENFKYSDNSIINNVSNESTPNKTAEGNIISVSINPEIAKPTITKTGGQAPTITNVGVSSATVSWYTDQQTDSVVEFKAINDPKWVTIGDRVPKDYNEVHVVNLFGLSPKTTYEYKIISRNSLGNEDILGDVLSEKQYLPTLTTNEFVIEPATVKFTTTTTGAVFDFNTNLDAQNVFVEYQMQTQPGDESIGGAASPSPEALIASPKVHKVVIGALKSNRAYSFKIKAISKDNYVTQYPNSQNNAFGTFNTKAFDTSQFTIAPSSSNVAERNITATTAQIVWQTSIPATSWVDYSTSSGKYDNSSGDNQLTKTHVVLIDGLVPGTKYYYRVRSKDTNDVEYTSQEYSFTAVLKPKISNLKLTEITPYSVTISWETNIETDTLINWGKTTSYGEKRGIPERTKYHTISVKDLEDNTEYHYQILARDETGNEVADEDKIVRTPLDTSGPKILDVKTDILPLNETDSTATVIISWKTDKPASRLLQYDEGIIGNRYSKSTIQDDSLSTSHTVIIKDLDPGKSYRYRIVAKDKRGNETISNNYNFLTPAAEKSILQLIIKSLEETFSWVKNVGTFFRGLGKKAK